MANRRLAAILKQMSDDHRELAEVVSGLDETPAKRDLAEAVEEIRRALGLADSHGDIDQRAEEAKAFAAKQQAAAAKAAEPPPPIVAPEAEAEDEKPKRRR